MEFLVNSTFVNRPKLLIISAALSVGLSACSPPAPEEGLIADPYEPMNRTSHAVNKGADRVFFRPASQVYGTVVPNPVRSSLSNVAASSG